MLVRILLCCTVLGAGVDAAWSQNAAPPPAGPPAGPAAQNPPAGDKRGEVRIDPETYPLDALVVAARQMMALGQTKEAQNVLDTALRRDPRFVDAIVTQGELAEATGERQNAREFYLRALKVNATDYKANFNLGRFYLSTNLSRQALPYLEQAELVAPPDQRPAALTMLARGYRAKGERVLAVDTAEKATRLAPDSFEAWHLKITALCELKRFDRADGDSQMLVDEALKETAAKPGDRKALEEVIRAFDTRLYVLRQVQRANYRLNAAGNPTDQLISGREGAAAKALGEIIALAQRKMVVEELRGMHEIAGLAREATRVEPGNVQWHLQLGGILRMIKDFVGAADAYRAALDIEPENPVALAALADLGASRHAPPPATSAPAEPESPPLGAPTTPAIGSAPAAAPGAP